MSSDPRWAIWIPELKYTAGSRPPLTYSAGGTKKKIPAASSSKASGAPAVQVGRGASPPKRSFSRHNSPMVRLIPPLTKITRSSWNEPVAASANATMEESARLMATAQNTRSSAESAALRERSPRGSRKMSAPGR